MSQILIDKSLSKLKHLDLYLDDSVDSVYFVEDLLTINPHCEISFLNSLIAFAFLPTIFSTLMP